MAEAAAAASSLALIYSGSLFYIGLIGLGALFATAPLGLRGRQAVRNIRTRPRFRGHRGHRTRHRRPHRHRRNPGRGRGRGLRRDDDSSLTHFKIFDESDEIDEYDRLYNIVNTASGDEHEPRSHPRIRVRRSGESTRTEAEKGTSVNFARNSEMDVRRQEFPVKPNPIAEHRGRRKRNTHHNMDELLLHPHLPLFAGGVTPRQGSKTPQEERIVRAIYDSDTRRCGQRLVCELSGIRYRSLTYEESEILKFIWYGDEIFEEMFPGESIRGNSPVLSAYKDAARMGAGGGPCHRIFQSCPVDALSMMSSIYSLRRL